MKGTFGNAPNAERGTRMSNLITDAMVETAARAMDRAYNYARAALDAAAPLIAATACAETTAEATERIARQLAATSAMTGRDALELIEAVQALQNVETTTVTDDARAEAMSRYSFGTYHGQMVQWHDAKKLAVDAFIAGAEWAAARAEGCEHSGDIAQLVSDLDAGEASDGYHTHNELYEYRLLYNAHAAHGWHAAGIPVVKSWHHSDGEQCFGGGWFVVTATLPTGQVSNHYKAEHWDLFQVPAVDLPPEYDGHTPAVAAERLRASLAAGRAETTTDLHWSNAAAAEYPGDEYEQYPLRTAFGRGVKWERKRAARKANEQ